MNTAKPSIDRLNTIAGRFKYPFEEWAKGYLAETIELLEVCPEYYRAFGPFWWLVKRAMNDCNYYEFGDVVDREWFEALDYGDEKLNLLAACLYYKQQSEQGDLTEQQHILEGSDGGNAVNISLTTTTWKSEWLGIKWRDGNRHHHDRHVSISIVGKGNGCEFKGLR